MCTLTFPAPFGRTGNARSTPHGRDHTSDAVLAGTKDGRIQALSVKSYSNLGAYPVINAPGTPRTLFGRSITGAYDIENPFFEVDAAVTNTVQVGPIRGSGRSEAIFLIERMIDMYAREIGMDPAEVRRRNMVSADQMPFENRLAPAGNTLVRRDLEEQPARRDDEGFKLGDFHWDVLSRMPDALSK